MNKKPKKTPQQRNLKKLPRLTKLNLEQLEGLAGGWAKPVHFNR